MLNEVFDKEAFEKSKEEIRELCNRFDANLDLLTLLNSKVLTFRYRSIGKKTGNNSYEYFSIGISKLPIPEISLEEQKPFIELADKMLELKRCLIDKKTPQEIRLLEKQIIWINR